MMRPGLAPPMSRAPEFAAAAAGLLLLTLLSGVATPLVASTSAHLPRSVSELVRPAGNTSINNDLVLNATSPAGTYSPGAIVHVEYRVTVLSATDGGSVTIYLPQLLASLPGLPAPVNLFLPPRNLTMGVGATVTAAPGTLTLRNTTSFNGTRPATINSQLVSLMGSAPFGDINVSGQWNWSITTPDGATASSGWQPASSPTIEPAEIASLLSLTPRTLTPPAPVTACLTGPLQGRTFSLHAETPKPFDDFVGNSTRDPIDGPSTWCLTVVIPVNITPQTILMHIWDYESVTLLLYIVKVKVVNNTSAAAAAVVPGTWTEYANAAILAGAIAIGVTTAVVIRREPVPPPPPVEPPPGSLG
jgi:hypothetical protein